jgi:hypothetical protein
MGIRYNEHTVSSPVSLHSRRRLKEQSILFKSQLYIETLKDSQDRNVSYVFYCYSLAQEGVVLMLLLDYL